MSFKGTFRPYYPFCSVFLACLAIACFTASSVLAQPRSAPENQLKAAFLYNFARFIDWPAQAFANDSSPFVLCVYDMREIGNALLPYAKKAINGRKLIIKQYAEPDEGGLCHILFLNTSDEKAVQKVLATLGNRFALTVGEAEGFTKIGGIINFIRDDNKLNFEINIDAAKRSGFAISSEVLQLAKIIREKQGGK